MALVAGLGFILMMLALGIGVGQGEAASNAPIGAIFILGLFLFLLGAIAWLVVVRPFERFDDINIPMDTGHHGHDDHAIVAAEPHAIEPHAESHP
jgi:hypothetical protein